MEDHTNLYKTVGQRIKERRKLLRITQTQLADLMGISYQQIQKYESGLNNVSLERLLQFSKLLNVLPDYFYQGLAIDSSVGGAAESDVIPKRPHRLQLTLIEDNMADAMLFKKSLEDVSELVDLFCIDDSEKVSDYLIHYATKYGTRAPDILVLDLNMPKINGLKLLKGVKANSQTAMIPVVILTNSISKKEMHEAYRLGAAGFIQKSIDFDDYKESIEILIHYWSKVVALPVK